MLSSRQYVDKNVSTNSHLLVGPSSGRKTLTIFPPGNDTVTIAGASPAVMGEGIVLMPGMAPIYLDVDYHGSAVQDEWYIVYQAGTDPVAYIEALM